MPLIMEFLYNWCWPRISPLVADYSMGPNEPQLLCQVLCLVLIHHWLWLINDCAGLWAGTWCWTQMIQFMTLMKTKFNWLHATVAASNFTQSRVQESAHLPHLHYLIHVLNVLSLPSSLHKNFTLMHYVILCKRCTSYGIIHLFQVLVLFLYCMF